MARRKKRKGVLDAIQGDVAGMTGIGIGLGVGATVVGKAGGPTSGFSTIGGFMPMISTVRMGGHALGMLKKYPYKKKRR